MLALAGLTLLCVNPALTQGDANINLLLVAVMSASPLVLLLRKARTVVPRVDVPLVLVACCVILLPILFHPQSVRWSTMFFTCANCFYFMMLARLVKIANISAKNFQSLIRAIVYAFFVVLLVQQICTLFGLYVPLNEGCAYSVKWKLNSLMAEPSHTTVALSALMFFYSQTTKIISPNVSFRIAVKNDIWLWIAFAWTLFTTVNASAFVLAPLAILPFVSKKNFYWFAIILALCIAISYTSPVRNNYLISRIHGISKTILSFDEEKICEADISAAARIVPTIRGAKSIDFSDSRLIIGYGVDADKTDIAPRPCDKKGDGFAGLFSMWHNYGAICAIAFWIAIASVTLIKRKPFSLIAFLFALQMSADYNMQLVWLIMAFSMTFKYSVVGDKRLLSKS